jgi:hypothetical protein
MIDPGNIVHPNDPTGLVVLTQVKARSIGTRLSCRSFAANAVRLQLHALAYNLGNFLRTGDARADQRLVASPRTI